MAKNASSRGTDPTPGIAVAAPPAASAPARSALWAYLAAGLGWAVPGLGHALQRKFDRAVVFFFSVAALGVLGLAMGAKLYTPPFSGAQGAFINLLHLLGFLGDLGAGLLFLVGWLGGLSHAYMGRASGDYGTVFFLCAGLLNLLAALDAYDIAVGKKP